MLDESVFAVRKRKNDTIELRVDTVNREHESSLRSKSFWDVLIICANRFCIENIIWIIERWFEDEMLAERKSMNFLQVKIPRENKIVEAKVRFSLTFSRKTCLSKKFCSRRKVRINNLRTNEFCHRFIFHQLVENNREKNFWNIFSSRKIEQKWIDVNFNAASRNFPRSFKIWADRKFDLTFVLPWKSPTVWKRNALTPWTIVVFLFHFCFMKIEASSRSLNWRGKYFSFSV